MGRAGMKRKGRSHLPKAGTRPARQRLAGERRREALHPFTSNPSGRRGTGFAILSAVLAIAVTIGIIALIAFT
jgi:hypothetical protein